MHPPCVVVELDVLEYLLLRLVVIFKGDPLGQLTLKGFEEGFGNGIDALLIVNRRIF